MSALTPRLASEMETSTLASDSRVRGDLLGGRGGGAVVGRGGGGGEGRGT